MPEITKAPEPTLFSPNLICSKLQSQLPEGLFLRPLQASDYDKGFLSALSQLTTVGDLPRALFLDRYLYLQQRNDTYFTIVIEDTKANRIAAAGTIFVERKFVHLNGKVGHIEDIVTNEQYRGRNLGRFIIEQLKVIGKSQGCYKIILDCSDKNVPFYEKCGFKQKEYEMAYYITENDATTPKQQAKL